MNDSWLGKTTEYFLCLMILPVWIAEKIGNKIIRGIAFLPAVFFSIPFMFTFFAPFFIFFLLSVAYDFGRGKFD